MIPLYRCYAACPLKNRVPTAALWATVFRHSVAEKAIKN
jgi:hypothetical protein